MDGVIQIGSLGIRAQAGLYVHTLELAPNCKIVTNGNVLTIVAARIVSEGGAIVSFLPGDLTATAPGA